MPAETSAWFALSALALLLFGCEQATAQNLADGIDVKGWAARPDCAGGTIKTDREKQEVELCVPQLSADTRRCELDLRGPDIRNRDLTIDFQLKVSEAVARPEHPIIVFQIHSFPDAGEQWRCPMAALRILPSGLQLGGGSDPNRITTAPSGCGGAGSTIQLYEVFKQPAADPSKWHRVRLLYRLSGEADGQVSAWLDGQQAGNRKGANIFNDEKPPYLKFGIYGFASKKDGPYCIKFRDLKTTIVD